MNKEIRKYDKNNNLIYSKGTSGLECWYKYDENNNEIHYKGSDGYEYWYKYDENNNKIYCNEGGNKFWFKWENNNRINITEKEYKEIEFRKQEKEYLNRTKCSRFELMDIQFIFFGKKINNFTNNRKKYE